MKKVVTLASAASALALAFVQFGASPATAAPKKSVCTGMWGGINASTIAWDGQKVVKYTFTGTSYPTGKTSPNGNGISFGNAKYTVTLSGVPVPGANLTATYEGPGGHGDGSFTCN
jgi:hypothetical protein